MQAPNLPFSFNLIFGQEDKILQNLVNMQFILDNEEQKVAQIIAEKKITNEAAEELTLCCDFYVESGREKEAVQYFNRGFQQKGEEDLSPLQRIFRSKGNQSEVKTSVQAHQGFVRIFYHFLINGELADQVEEIDQQISIAESSGVSPNFNMTLELKGTVSHNKKNRQNVKVNYANFNLNIQKMLSKQLIQWAESMEVIPYEELGQFVAYMDLWKKLKRANIKLKFDSFRKISAYYNKLVKDNKESETKGFPYINQGIFRKRAQVSFVYRKRYAGRLIINYESQDVFIRLIKVYAKTFEKVFDVDLYE